ncbi:MAG: sigma-70 family RNA polymerase sigma factor [Bacteriovoracaceae bacterium]|nr:sigma-70 family RNA polymerase sigma factor [Bacteriovoracaceae bacterium]
MKALYILIILYVFSANSFALVGVNIKKGQDDCAVLASDFLWFMEDELIKGLMPRIKKAIKPFLKDYESFPNVTAPELLSFALEGALSGIRNYHPAETDIMNIGDFAIYHARFAIRNGIRTLVKISSRQRQLLKAMPPLIEEYAIKMGHEPSDEWLAANLQAHVSTIKFLRHTPNLKYKIVDSKVPKDSANPDDDAFSVLDMVPSPYPSQLEVLLKKEKQQSVRKAINSLSNSHKQVLTARYIQQKSLQEIAQELNSSVSTISSRLKYAKDALKRKLKKFDQ